MANTVDRSGWFISGLTCWFLRWEILYCLLHSPPKDPQNTHTQENEHIQRLGIATDNAFIFIKGFQNIIVDPKIKTIILYLLFFHIIKVNGEYSCHWSLFTFIVFQVLLKISPFVVDARMKMRASK